MRGAVRAGEGVGRPGVRLGPSRGPVRMARCTATSHGTLHYHLARHVAGGARHLPPPLVRHLPPRHEALWPPRKCLGSVSEGSRHLPPRHEARERRPHVDVTGLARQAHRPRRGGAARRGRRERAERESREREPRERAERESRDVPRRGGAARRERRTAPARAPLPLGGADASSASLPPLQASKPSLGPGPATTRP